MKRGKGSSVCLAGVSCSDLERTFLSYYTYLYVDLMREKAFGPSFLPRRA